jgi:serine/threonine-protein kinase
MGDVWLAERADSAYEARVAVKLVRGGFAHPDLARRFRRERQILADLRHPNIARLLDGGTAPDGTPYLVMEYVDGVPVTEHVEERGLGLRERLRLFREICDAVQHAHASLVIHRDIKPSNVLVDREGTPKLVDFGIARPLSGRGTAGVTATSRLMTPSYASPEQVSGKRMTVATDVYSLGVLLHELLTGEQPFAGDGDAAVTVQQRVLEEDPPAPSAVLRRAGEGRPPIAPRSVAGDLDTIVARALRKEPERRFGSVQALADDLGRHLRGEAVLSRAPTLRYRAGRFVRRHAALVAAAALVVLSLAGGLGVAVWQAREADLSRVAAEEARRQAEDARREAEAALARSEAATDFLTDLFEGADPREAQGREVTVREILDRGAGRIEELSDQPDLQAGLMQVLAGVHTQLGEYGTSAELMQRAVAVRSGMPDGDPRALVDALSVWGVALDHLGLPDSAAAVYGRALAEAEEARIPDEDPDVQGVLGNLAVTYNRMGRDREAEEMYRRIIAAQREGMERTDLRRTVPLNNLGLQLAIEGRFDEAEPLLRESYRIRREVEGDDHPGTAIAAENLGMMLREAGRYDEAEAVLSENLERRRLLLGDEHRYVGEGLFSLGLTLALRAGPGDLARADSLLRASLQVHRDALGAGHRAVGYSLHALGVRALRAGEPGAAADWFRQALAIRRDSESDAPREEVRSLVGLGRALSGMERGGAGGGEGGARGRGSAADRGPGGDAVPVLREALALARETLDPGDPVRSEARAALGLALAATGADAAPHFREGVGALAGRIGSSHPELLRWCARGQRAGLEAPVCPAASGERSPEITRTEASM